MRRSDREVKEFKDIVAIKDNRASFEMDCGHRVGKINTRAKRTFN